MRGAKIRFTGKINEVIALQGLFYTENSMDWHSWKYSCFFLGELQETFI